MVTPMQSTSLMQALKEKFGGKVNVLYSRGIVRSTDLFSQMRFESMTHVVYSNDACTGKSLRSGPATRIADYRTSIYWFVNLPVAVERRCEIWAGSYTAPVTGQYTVLGAAALRDAYEVRVDGKVVLNQPKSEDQSPNSTQIALHAGDRVDLTVRYLPDSDVDRLGVAIVPTQQVIAPEVDTIASNADAVVVAAGFAPESEGESHDRTFDLPYGQVELINRIAARTRGRSLQLPAVVDMRRRTGSAMCPRCCRIGTSARKAVER